MKYIQFFNTNRHKVLLICILCLFAVCFALQMQSANSKPGKKPAERSRKFTKIDLENADENVVDRLLMPDYQLLRGSVRIRHGGMVMFCDSAYLFENSNSFEAFGSIRMEQGDTLTIYGDHLYYDGILQLARLRRNVKMENRNTTLLTDSLNFDRRANIGYFFEGGVISDEKNELTSVYGQYSPATKISIFQFNVKLVNDQMTLYSDTLIYSNANKIAFIKGPSTIVSDSNTIYSSRGWYNTGLGTSMLLDRSLLVNKDKTLTGDTVYYNRNKGVGKVFGHMHLRDSLNKSDLYGNFGFYNEKTKYAYATDSAWVREYSRPDTVFIHADTLKVEEPDTTYRVLSGIRNVRYFSREAQGVCDSMRYSTKDSVLRLYKSPILWNASYQLNGDTIHAYMSDTTIKRAHVIGYAFVATQEDSTLSFYNQLSGKELIARFENGDIRQVDVSGNVESVFYPMDSDSVLIGMNRTESSFMTMFVKNRKLEKMKVWPSPNGSLTPIPLIKPAMKLLKNFRWYEAARPKNARDIFRRVTLTTEPIKRITRRKR